MCRKLRLVDARVEQEPMLIKKIDAARFGPDATPVHRESRSLCRTTRGASGVEILPLVCEPPVEVGVVDTTTHVRCVARGTEAVDVKSRLERRLAVGALPLEEFQQNVDERGFAKQQQRLFRCSALTPLAAIDPVERSEVVER